MKSIKAIIVVFLAFVMAVPAFAGTNGETGLGALVGAVAGRALCRNCNQRTQNIATGVGLVAGGLAGNAYGNRADRRENIQQQYANNDSVRSYPQETRVVRTSQATDWVEQPAQPVYVEPAMVARAQQLRPQRVVQSSGCDEEYYKGQFNPEAAHAYCEGRRQREAQVRQAYAEGLAGR